MFVKLYFRNRKLEIFHFFYHHMSTLWTQEEIDTLLKYVENYKSQQKYIQWKYITDTIPTHTKLECQQMFLQLQQKMPQSKIMQTPPQHNEILQDSLSRVKLDWSDYQVKKLEDYVNRHIDPLSGKVDWTKNPNFVCGHSWQQCRAKWIQISRKLNAYQNTVVTFNKQEAKLLYNYVHNQLICPLKEILMQFAKQQSSYIKMTIKVIRQLASMGINDPDAIEAYINWSEEETKVFSDYCLQHSVEGLLFLEKVEEILPYKMPIQIYSSFPLVMQVLVKNCQNPLQQEIMQETYIYKRYQISKYQQQWSKNEISALRRYILNHTNEQGEINWEDVDVVLPHKTLTQCLYYQYRIRNSLPQMKKAQLTMSPMLLWNKDNDETLLRYVEQYKNLQTEEIDWNYVTTVLPFTRAQCISRLEEIQAERPLAPAKEETRGKRWTEEEHQNFLAYVQRFTDAAGRINWNEFGRFVPSRTPISAQKHYIKIMEPEHVHHHMEDHTEHPETQENNLNIKDLNLVPPKLQAPPQIPQDFVVPEEPYVNPFIGVTEDQIFDQDWINEAVQKKQFQIYDGNCKKWTDIELNLFESLVNHCIDQNIVFTWEQIQIYFPNRKPEALEALYNRYLTNDVTAKVKESRPTKSFKSTQSFNKSATMTTSGKRRGRPPKNHRNSSEEEEPVTTETEPTEQQIEPDDSETESEEPEVKKPVRQSKRPIENGENPNEFGLSKNDMEQSRRGRQRIWTQEKLEILSKYVAEHNVNGKIDWTQWELALPELTMQQVKLGYSFYLNKRSENWTMKEELKMSPVQKKMIEQLITSGQVINWDEAGKQFPGRDYEKLQEYVDAERKSRNIVVEEDSDSKKKEE